MIRRLALVVVLAFFALAMLSFCLLTALFTP
jgi:hypothetical protein